MAEKRKRGRPRKPKLGVGRPFIPFERLPDGVADAEDAKKLANWYRNYLSDKPYVVDAEGHFQKWLNAAADAIEAGDVVRTGYYALGAIKVRALLAYIEPLPIDTETPTGAMSPKEAVAHIIQVYRDEKAVPLFDLAELGRATLKANKKRGPKKHIARR